MTEVLKIIPGTVQSCSAVLKENNMLAISPGGVYEAQFGDCYYHLMWKKRLGFAKVAIDAKTVSFQPTWSSSSHCVISFVHLFFSKSPEEHWTFTLSMLVSFSSYPWLFYTWTIGSNSPIILHFCDMVYLSSIPVKCQLRKLTIQILVYWMNHWDENLSQGWSTLHEEVWK